MSADKKKFSQSFVDRNPEVVLLQSISKSNKTTLTSNKTKKTNQPKPRSQEPVVK